MARTEKQCSLSQLTIDILLRHYGLAFAKSPKEPLSKVTKNVLNEVEAFVKENQSGTKFDLLTASKSFKNIHMIADGKPSTNRATVGKIFASKLGAGPFATVSIVRTESGAVKKSVNRATMYQIL